MTPRTLILKETIRLITMTRPQPSNVLLCCHILNRLDLPDASRIHFFRTKWRQKKAESQSAMPRSTQPTTSRSKCSFQRRPQRNRRSWRLWRRSHLHRSKHSRGSSCLRSSDILRREFWYYVNFLTAFNDTKSCCPLKLEWISARHW